MDYDNITEKTTNQIRKLTSDVLQDVELAHEAKGYDKVRTRVEMNADYKIYRSTIHTVYLNKSKIKPDLYKEFLDEHKKYQRMRLSVYNNLLVAGPISPRKFINDWFGGKYKSYRILRVILMILFISMIISITMTYLLVYTITILLMFIGSMFISRYYNLYWDKKIYEL